MMVCQNCKTLNSDTNIFCGICGSTLKPHYSTVLVSTVPTTPDTSSPTVAVMPNPSSQSGKRWKGKRVFSYVICAYAVCITLVLAWNLVLGHIPLIKLGGLDLNSFCHAYGYQRASDSFCSSDLDMTQACRWHYPQANNPTARSNNPTNPDSWTCSTSKGTSLGGINDLTNYCHLTYPNGVSEADPQGNGTNKWICKQEISLEFACRWEYGPSVEARMDQGLWYCYSTP